MDENGKTTPFETKILEAEKDGETKYIPSYIINGKSHLCYWKNELIYYDTREEAEEYLSDE